MGGSNTYAGTAGTWRLRVTDWLDRHLTSNEVNAGVNGTNSWYGLIRLESEVLAYSPDLVVVEFAVNDAADASNTERANGWAACAEALLKRLKAALPDTRIVVLNLVQQEEYVATQGYIDSRDKWAALAAHHGLSTHRIDLFLQGVIGTPTPTQEQCEVYGDFIHFTADGHEQIFNMLEGSLPGYVFGVPGSLAETDYFADTADWEGDPIIRTGIDNDGETGAGWSTSGTARVSSTANDTISWTGTFSGFGLDTIVGAGAGVLAWKLDDGDYSANRDLSAFGNYHALYSFDRGPHTITVKVVSGTVTINRFLAV